MIQGVFEVKEAVIAYRALTSAGTFRGFADSTPGGSLAAVAALSNGNLPVTAGSTPQTRTLPLDGLICTQFLPEFESGSGGAVLIPLEGHIKVRPIHVYLTAGEKWTGQPIALGAGG